LFTPARENDLELRRHSHYNVNQVRTNLLPSLRLPWSPRSGDSLLFCACKAGFASLSVIGRSDVLLSLGAVQTSTKPVTLPPAQTPAIVQIVCVPLATPPFFVGHLPDCAGA